MNTPDTRTSDYVCFDCGRPFVRDLMNFDEFVAAGVTCHMGECGLCGEEKGVTHVRHFNWLRKPKSDEQG